MPALSSHSFDHAERSRPDACSSDREQVVQRAVSPGVGVEVTAQAVEERVMADPRDELLQDRCALRVSDAVEVGLDGLDVDDVGGDRVRGRQLVLPTGPGLFLVGEGGPGVGPAGGLDGREVGHVGGERLVQPQVVPPPHRDEVAEPHVRHLVQDRARAALVRRVGDPRPEDVVLEKRHRSCVLHRARVELRDEQLVVLSERIRPLRTALRRSRNPAWSPRRCHRRRGTAPATCDRTRPSGISAASPWYTSRTT